MSKLAKLLAVAALIGALAAVDARAERQTVCSITVNSPDEQAAFRRHLPADRFRFVELVERGRPDWLAAACRQDVRCDVLVISGHYDGGHEFFSDRLDASEYLPVHEMERVSCSTGCPGLFSQLKEVYLFGCNTLNPGARNSASAEIVRSLLRSGHPPGEAERLAHALGERHGESSRDRMRLVFANVPVIYGFASTAPVGPAAAAILERYFHAAGASEIGTGRPSARLLGQFSAQSLVVTSGLAAGDPQMAFRGDVCQFVDDRTSAAQKLAFVHRLLGRETAEGRLFLDRIEEYVGSLSAADRQAPAVAQELAAIARDDVARERFLEFARDADQPAVRARMVKLAHRLGWLTAEGERAELAALVGALLAKDNADAADVDLVCALNDGHELDAERAGLPRPAAGASRVAGAAMLACLGSAEPRTRVLEALASADERDVELAQVYLRHRPPADGDEVRGLARAIAGMSAGAAQIRALDALARLHVADRASLDELVGLYTRTPSWGVQAAVAGVLIRADYRALAAPELVATLRRGQLKSPPGDDLVDVLIRRLQAP